MNLDLRSSIGVEIVAFGARLGIVGVSVAERIV